MFDNQISSIVFLAVCHILVLLFVLLLLARIIYLLLRNKNANRTEKITATAILLLFFKSTLQQSILDPVRVLTSNIQKLFYLLTAYSNADEGMTSGEKTKFLEKHPIDENSISITQILDAFPLSSFLTAIAFGCIAYYAVRYTKRNFFATAPEVQQYPSGKAVVLYNLFISLVLAFSLFLVVSVCITIPYFNQFSKPTNFTAIRLDSTLSGYANKDSFKVSGIGPSPFTGTALDSVVLADNIKPQFAKLALSEQKAVLQSMNDLQKQFGSYNNGRTSALNALDDFKNQYRQKEGKYKSELVVNFETATQSILVDKAELFQSSVRSFTDFVESEKAYFNYFIRNVKNTDSYNSDAIQDYVRDIKMMISDIAGTEKRDSLYNPLSRLYATTPTLVSYESSLNLDDRTTFVPRSEKNGDEWGIFGFMANYLIKTQSSELVLLMGMFGFGLLGASLLSFQNTNSNGNFIEAFTTKPLIQNFGNVLARGFGAALVIYLATKGGLAIFSAGTANDANGYILLLTCFIGAVFSEKVWDKVQKTFYGTDKATGGPPPPPPPPGGNGAPPPAQNAPGNVAPFQLEQ